jgi:NPCBM/NEW2 domain
MTWDDILELSRNAASAEPLASGRTFNLILTNGDRLSGSADSITDEKLQWQNRLLSTTSWPLDRVAAIIRAGVEVTDLDHPRTDDLVRLGNGDVTHGIVTQINVAGVTLQTDSASPTLPWSSISAVLFSTPQSAEKSSPSRSFRIHLNGDQVITVPNISMGGGQLKLALDMQNFRQVDESNVTLIEQINGPVSWLTARNPIQNIYKPFFSENFPARFDQTVDDGQPIRAAYPAFHHGIGCHSYSKLIYALDGTYRNFRTQFAIDSNSPLADVTVRILLSDVVVFEQKNVKAGQVYPVKVVSLTSAKTLALEVDYGENYATQDRFVWLDPALVDAQSATTQPSAP